MKPAVATAASPGDGQGVALWLGSTLGRGPKAMQAGHTGHEPGFESESDDRAGEGVCELSRLEEGKRRGRARK